jgi:SnoaL-like polyketide cyclase
MSAQKDMLLRIAAAMILDMVEEGDRVAARMQFSGMVDGRSVFLSAVAIYRFVDSRIAEDWGIGFRGNWPERVALPPGGSVQQS